MAASFVPGTKVYIRSLLNACEHNDKEGEIVKKGVWGRWEVKISPNRQVLLVQAANLVLLQDAAMYFFRDGKE